MHASGCIVCACNFYSPDIYRPIQMNQLMILVENSKLGLFGPQRVQNTISQVDYKIIDVHDMMFSNEVCSILRLISSQVYESVEPTI